tara:strand:+ start:540 stop:704 length:165 start_codon:yes stop_codon:yes gene_type:complete
MVNKIIEFYKEFLVVPREFEEEVKTLHKLGVEYSEIQYLINLKIKEEKLNISSI